MATRCVRVASMCVSDAGIHWNWLEWQHFASLETQKKKIQRKTARAARVSAQAFPGRWRPLNYYLF